LIAGCVIGVVCGLALPLLMVFSAWVLPLTVIFALLWVWAGWPSVAVGALSVLVIGSRYPFLGWGAAAAMLLLTAPGVLAAALTDRRRPFFRAVGISVALQLGAMVLVTAIAWLIFRQNLVDVATGSARGLLEELPLARQHFLILQLGQMGFFGSNTGINFSNAILTNDQLKSLVDQLFGTINSGLKETLPAYVLTAGATSGGLAYAGAAWIRVRRGDAPSIPFVKPDGWRLNADLIIGPPALAAVCLLLDRLGVSGADAAYVALLSLAELLFTVQGIGVLERRMKPMGMAPGYRTGITVAALIIGYRVMPFLGLYSALFGSEGLISKQIRKRMDGKGDE
jgi:hypothetical protein